MMADKGHEEYAYGESDKTCTAMKLAMGGGSAPSAAALQDGKAATVARLAKSMPGHSQEMKPVTRNG